MALALLLGGVSACGSRSSGTGAGMGIDDGGIGEDSLSSGSSLARARQGLPPEEDGILKDIHFEVDSYDLSPEARAVLAENTHWLKQNGSSSLEIEGHADDRGTIEYNLALGARRAKAVQDYLTVLGVAKSRITTISYGEELPVCKQQTAECWRRNRRAHFVVVMP